MWLERRADIALTGESSTDACALEQLRQSCWDRVLLDIALPDRSDFDPLRQMNVARPGSRVLMISTMSEEHYGRHAIACGGGRLLAKRDNQRNHSLDAVTKVLSDRRFVSPALSEMLAAQITNPCEQSVHAELSAREFQILYKLAGGRRRRSSVRCASVPKQ